MPMGNSIGLTRVSILADYAAYIRRSSLFYAMMRFCYGGTSNIGGILRRRPARGISHD